MGINLRRFSFFSRQWHGATGIGKQTRLTKLLPFVSLLAHSSLDLPSQRREAHRVAWITGERSLLQRIDPQIEEFRRRSLMVLPQRPARMSVSTNSRQSHLDDKTQILGRKICQIRKNRRHCIRVHAEPTR